ncbi:MAG: hypothetical protein BGO29_06270 [Bacteroidales bacterium 36-12]|nr:MAG: hypothetical protein BGO29_06270 [Bacteroidales bacterium 36-12]
MKTTTTFFILLSLLLIQTDRCNAASNEELLKLDSIVISDFTMYEYSYNQQGQLVSEKFFVARDSTHMIYDLMHLVEHHYENGKRISSVNSHNTAGNLRILDRTVYEYDGEKLSVEIQEYYHEGQWNPVRKSDYFYEDDGLLLRIEYSVRTNNDFLLTERAVYHYDEQNKELLTIVSQVPASEEQWLDKTKTKFDYEGGNLICQIEYNWNDTINDWKAILKKEFIYDGSNNNEVIYRESNYSGNAFVITLEQEITLDITCPAKNLILPYENSLPYKVESENNIHAQKSSSYYYSLLTTSGVNSLDDSGRVSLYPNPAKDILNIRSDQRIDAIDIFDISGRLSAVYSGSNYKFDISDLDQGIYYLQINIAGRYTTLKFIKR